MSGFNTPVSDRGGFESPPIGDHPATCVAMIDLGTHEGQNNPYRKIAIVWELAAEYRSDDSRFVVIKDFGWTLRTSKDGTKSKLRQFLEEFEGRDFLDRENIDLASFVGRPCVVEIGNVYSQSGRQYREVLSCRKPEKGLSVPAPTMEPFTFLIDAEMSMDDPAIPPRVPHLYGRRIADVIKASREWTGRSRPASPSVAVAVAIADDQEDEDIPF
jgi:hypothetical protein